MKKNYNKNYTVFTLIALFIPLAFFILLELVLRLSGVGRSVPLFVESPMFTNTLHVNPQVIHRYFPIAEMAPRVRPDIVLFDREKTGDSFRIVIQGGSTAAGFPYGKNASLQGMLNQRFKRLYPDKKIEIISTAMAAVNSYTMRDFVDEIIAIKPDLVLIYAGHNEYLGVMGVGSNYASIGGRTVTLIYLQLRSLRIYQLLEKAFYLWKTPDIPAQDNRPLMAKIAQNKNITRDSDTFLRGVDQFSGNLSSILRAYENAEIPVFVSNLVSNERDQLPFSTIADVDWPAYQESLSVENSDRNISTLLDSDRAMPSAETHYKLGLNYTLKGEADIARNHFIAAKDYDELRFRAPSNFNAIIEEEAEEHGATFIDAASFFLEDTGEKVIGNSLMLEHLHPNERGYFLLAESFSRAIVKSKIIDKKTANYSPMRAWTDIPLTELDRLEGHFTITKLTNAYPFKPQSKKGLDAVKPPVSNTIAGKALTLKSSGVDWMSFQQQLISKYKNAGNIKEAARIAANTSDTLSRDPQAAVTAASLYGQRKDLSMALFYYQRAVSLAPQNRDYLLALARTHFSMDDEQSSAKVLEKIKGLRR